MIRLIVWRLVQLPFLLLIIYTITFVLAWLVPGDPLQREKARQPPKAVQEAMRSQYNLDDPWAFYWDYLYDAAVKLDFGPSLNYRDWRVSGILASSLPVSLQVGFGAILVALVVGVGTGMVAGVWRGGVADMASLSIALIGVSLPTFVTGSALLVLFSIQLQWLPIGGWGGIERMILPVITLSLPFAAYIARLTRMGMIDVLGTDYIRAAAAKGVPHRQIVMQHALKVAFLPVLSFIGPAAAGAMTGSFVVEKVFNVPGMGQHFVDAVQNKDLFLIMGVVLSYATLLVLFNLAVDVAYALVDPRIDLEQ